MTRPQGVEVILGLDMGEHQVVHRGGDQQRGTAGEHRARHDLIRQSDGQLRDAVGGRRHDRDQLRPFGQRDMAFSRTLGREPVGGDRVIGQCFQGQWRDEAGCLRRHHHADLRAALGQETNDLDRLVPGDPATDPNDHPAALQPPAGHTRVWRRSCWAAIMARISRAVSSTSRLQTTCS